MRIFSNFDTKVRKRRLEEYQDKFGVDNVLLFWRSKLYWVLKIFLPSFFLFVVTVLWLVLFYTWFDGDYFGYFIFAFIVFDLVWLFPITGKFIDYKMDFIIVTPDLLIMYDQWGLFKKNVITINEKSLKTVFVKRPGFLYSVFNNGDIIFLSEWDTNYGEITLRWVAKPEYKRNKIARIMGRELRSSVEIV